VSRREAAELAGVPLAAVDKAIEQRVIRSVRGRGSGIPVEEIAALALVHRAGVPLPASVKGRIRNWVVASSDLHDQPHELTLSDALVVRSDDHVAAIAERAAGYVRDRAAFIERDAEVKAGEPVIRGTRPTALAVHARLSSGDSIELATEYPHIPREALEAAGLYGRTHPRRGRPPRPRAS
jgi:uncharacterized protein (DUF433 family)